MPRDGRCARVFARQQHHGNLVEPAVEGVGVAIEQVALASGDEGDGRRLSLERRSDDPRRPHVLGEEVLPRFHGLGVHEHRRAVDVARLGELFFAAPAHVHDPRPPSDRDGRGPGERDRADAEARRGRDFHARRSLAPRNGHPERFRGHVVGARRAEGFDSPANRLLHRWCSGHPPADLVGQPAQVVFERRGLHGLRYHALSVRSCRGNREQQEDQAKTLRPCELHGARLEPNAGEKRNKNSAVFSVVLLSPRSRAKDAAVPAICRAQPGVRRAGESSPGRKPRVGVQIHA